MVEDVLDINSILLAEVLVLGQISHEVGDEFRVDAHWRQAQVLDVTDLCLEHVEAGLDDDLLGMVPSII